MKNLATGQIRADHTHVTAAFHRFDPHADLETKRGLASHICLALKIHAALEEEIFYPAMREAGVDSEVIEHTNLPEHAEQHRLIQELDHMEADNPAFESTLMELMRTTLRHVADEETKLLVDADRLVSRERLNELGRQMTKRRMELSRELGGEIVHSVMQATSTTTKVLAGSAVLAGTYMLGRAFSRGGSAHRH